MLVQRNDQEAGSRVSLPALEKPKDGAPAVLIVQAKVKSWASPQRTGHPEFWLGKADQETGVAARPGGAPAIRKCKMLSMRAMPRLPLLLIAMGLSSLAPSSVVQTSVPTSTKVPDSATAVGIAEKVLTNIYGKKVIESERPFTVVLSDGIWHVYGTLYCKNNEGNVITNMCLGGVASANIRQRDGHVLRTGHTK